MTDSKYFNFTTFKSVMDIADIDEPTYSFLLRSIFSYLKQKYSINLDATTTYTVDISSTGSSLILPYNTVVLPEQLVVAGSESVYIDIVTNNGVLTTTIGVSPSFSVVPSTITIYTTLIPFELQYAIYQHAKFLFESQKKNTQIISAVTDSMGGRTIYKEKLSTLIKSVYTEYSPNLIAFI